MTLGLGADIVPPLAAIRGRDLADFMQDYATSPVPESRTVSGLRIGLILSVLSFAVPSLVAGAQIGGGLGLERGMVAFGLSGLFLSVVGTAVGIIGVRNRVSSYVLIQCLFGRSGANPLCLAIALSMLGWYGVNMDLLSAALQHLLSALFGWRPAAWAIEVAAGVLMTVTAIYGFSMLNRVSGFVSPVLMLLTLYLGAKGFASYSEDLPSVIPELPQLSDGEAVTAIAGGMIVTAVLMQDFTRFARRSGDAATATMLPCLVFSSLAYLAAAAAAIVAQEADILLVMLALGLGVGALGLVFLSSWVTNVINLYSCSLSLSSVFPKRQQWHLTLVSGVLATIAALLNILDNFTTFLIGMSIIFAPIGGIFIADFYLLRRLRPYSLAAFGSGRPNWAALLAWGLGAGMALLSAQAGIRLTGIEVADSLLVALLAYPALAWRRGRSAGESEQNSGNSP